MTVTVMPGESEEDLDRLAGAIRNEWKPQGDHESFLVDQMISARRRLERLARWEQEAINRSLEASSDVLAELEAKNSVFDKLERYTRAAERAYSKAVKELRQHRADQAKPAKQNEAAAKQNKRKEAEEWLQSELAKLERTRITDPFVELCDFPEQNESDCDDRLGPPSNSADPALR